MKIALFGYGKMGKTIERIALERGHTIVAKIDVDTTDYELSKADVAIDFSVPAEAFNNINLCFNNNVPIVSGTTGWLDDFDRAVANCKSKNGAFIYASNYSLGVNLFFELNKQLAKLMKDFDVYNVSLEETHHTQKLDAPSGTAITLAEGIIEQTNKQNWSLDVTENEKTIPITSKRIENVPGTHIVSYTSDVDEIEITHTAKNRDGFALGAVIAAEWLKDKKGIFTMKDVLGI
ncbi:4-hydroxy-tetrahydrodipicolinate reductase [Aureibaculum sp. 2210JD6-5]|uniref:4-hydroxy-tetrahydrodipicolinate reductase n=1 Tax=Aureibaculum sp. 2210JD6-5 TaxID=3103957 RepID=UPI002AAD965A|nr:4-hydroxy-tetrahydrodipicolinate reductase [Aureibaculum sp. 2210JD6-5]MDY7395549.1 4-hydroxy-tetrahydrodipicolinate reductase [Aureibaculum sp. 2210JD6-5]